MKKIKGLLICLSIISFAHGQTQTQVEVKMDTVKIINGELIINNSTRDSSGYLYNLGNGITQFKPIAKSVDTLWSSNDTLYYKKDTLTGYLLLNVTLQSVTNKGNTTTEPISSSLALISGDGAQQSNHSQGGGNLIVGRDNSNSGESNTILGIANTIENTVAGATAIGALNEPKSNFSTTIGYGNVVETSQGGIALGNGAYVSNFGEIAFGSQISSTGDAQERKLIAPLYTSTNGTNGSFLQLPENAFDEQGSIKILNGTINYIKADYNLITSTGNIAVYKLEAVVKKYNNTVTIISQNFTTVYRDAVFANVQLQLISSTSTAPPRVGLYTGYISSTAISDPIKGAAVYTISMIKL